MAMKMPAKKAGTASLKLSHLISRKDSIIITPITTRAGAVAANGMALTKAARNALSAKQTDTTTLVSPVRDAEEKYVSLLRFLVLKGEGALQLTADVSYRVQKYGGDKQLVRISAAGALPPENSRSATSPAGIRI